ncbi:MAG TPA: cytochrome c [Myxococcota bacterium]|nr:cytochrome c [Myxococcota bacterium]
MKTSALSLLLCVCLGGCLQEMGIFGHIAPYSAIDEEPIARPLLDHTVARGHLVQNGSKKNGSHEWTAAGLKKGQERYEIFCTPCHGISGFGDGAIVERGFPTPPSFHQERLRMVNNEHLVQVIRNGFGVMYGFSHVIDTEEAWGIAGYIRALQLSQHVNLSHLSVDQKNDILRELK